MENFTSLGYCPTCREMMVTENGVPTCLNCATPTRPKHIVKPPPVTDVPTDTDFKKVVGTKVDSRNQVVVGKAEMVVTGNTAQDALDIMRSLSMPKNMQEFKQIQKIIKQLEKLVGENNGH